jgi:hypothetical protein
MLSFNGVAFADTLTKLSAWAIAVPCTVNSKTTALKNEIILFKMNDFKSRKTSY